MYPKHDLPEKEGNYSREVEVLGFGVSLYLGLKPELTFLQVPGSKMNHESSTELNKYYYWRGRFTVVIAKVVIIVYSNCNSIPSSSRKVGVLVC